MGEKFILALAQASSVLYDKEKNLLKAEKFMVDASARGAKAILFPEMFSTGYMTWDRVSDLAEPLNGPLVKRLALLARQYGLLTVCGFPEKNSKTKPYNSACVIDSDGSVLGSYHKTHLFSNEPDVFTPGEDIKAFNTSLGRIGVMICYDTEFPETARLLALDGVQLILAPTANMEPYSQFQSVFLRARAMENGICAATTNTIGYDGTYHYFGQSAAADPEGRLLCLGGSDEELLFAEINLTAIPPKDASLQYLNHRRPELYNKLCARV